MSTLQCFFPLSRSPKYHPHLCGSNSPGPLVAGNWKGCGWGILTKVFRTKLIEVEPEVESLFWHLCLKNLWLQKLRARPWAPHTHRLTMELHCEPCTFTSRNPAAGLCSSPDSVDSSSLGRLPTWAPSPFSAYPQLSSAIQAPETPAAPAGPDPHCFLLLEDRFPLHSVLSFPPTSSLK